MALQKEIIALGDIEIGGGTITDDFISDKALSELILELARREHPVDLVLNGDTFDFLKCPYPKNGEFVYPRHITWEVSLAKLRLMYHAHQRVFGALRRFVRSKMHNLYFIFGNHDMDLLFPEVQSEIKSLFRRWHNVHFGVKYHQGKVYIEHGMQYDPLSRINFKKAFLVHRGKELLNLSWISFGLISKFMSLKEEHPFMERIINRPRLFNSHRQVLKKFVVRAAGYFLRSMVYYPWRYPTDPTYTFPRGLWKELIRRIRRSHWDLEKIAHVFKRHKRRTLLQNRIYVLGHVHEKYVEEKRDVVIIHPGSWRDEYDLDEKGWLIPHVKRYVQILVSDAGHKYHLIDYPIKRSPLKFDQVVKGELKYLRLVAEEEEFRV